MFNKSDLIKLIFISLRPHHRVNIYKGCKNSTLLHVLLKLDKQIKLQSTLKVAEKSISQLFSLPNGYLLFTSPENRVSIWNKSFQCCEILEYKDEISSIAHLSDGNAAIAGCSGKLSILDSTKGYKCKSTLVLGSHIKCLTARGDLLAVGLGNGEIPIINILDNQKTHVLKGHKLSITCLIVFKDNNLASGSADKTIRIWDLSDFKCINTIICAFKIHYLYLSEENLLAIDSMGGMYVWESGYRPTGMAHLGYIISILQLKNGNLVTSSCAKAEVWDNCVCIKALLGHSGVVFSLLEIVTYCYLVTASRDFSIRVWDTHADYLCIQTILVKNNGRLCLLSEGEFASYDKDIKIWGF
jgi:WD40 repeat protein